MANIQKRATAHGTRYRVQIRLRGFPAETATFRRLSDAKEWAQKIEAAMREGRHFPERASRKRTLGDLVNRYTNRGAKGSGKTGGNTAYLKLSPKEQSKRITMLDWWVTALGDPTLDRLASPLITEWRDRLLEGDGPRGRPASGATANRYLAALSCACTFGRRLNWLRRNPVKDVERVGEGNGRVRFLNESERTRLIGACCDSNDRRLYALVVTAISTGARQGELLGLRWADVDVERGLAVFHQTKNRERRAVPVVGKAAEALSRLGKVRRVDTDLVFAGNRGQASFPQTAWKKALVAAEIEDFRFHDLRHTAASYLAMNGATLAEIAEVLGHKTLAMVKRYSHMTEQHTSKVVSRMNEAIFGES